MRSQSPPRTPPSGTAKTRKGSIRPIDTQHAAEETFFDEGTPVRDAHRSEDVDTRPRDSHDLSLNDHTRDSVVDNMLLSLDSMSVGPSAFSNPIPPYASLDDDEYYPNNNPYAPPRGPRARGHTYSSSNPSEYDLRPSETFKYPTYHHTRQSNSSSNFQTLRSSHDTQNTWTQERQRSHSRGGAKTGSKGSGSSMDYGLKKTITAPRPQYVHRTSSSDVHNDPQGPMPEYGEDLSGVMGRGRPVPVTYHSFEAAPSPTVHSGPQRFGDTPLASPGFPPQPPYAPPQIPSSRRNSIRSATSRSGKKPGSRHPDASILAQANDFYNAALSRDGAYDATSAPSPNVGLLKQEASSANQSSPKEKPGFFRRVFGSSSKKENTPPAGMPPQSSHSAEAKRDERPKTMQSVPRPASKNPPTTGRPASKTISKPTPPDSSKMSPDTSSQQQPPPLPTLNKKHSSFFRRRKKSVVEAMPPTLLPLQLQAAKNANIDRPQDSPGAGSLYKVMDPYLSHETAGSHPAEESHAVDLGEDRSASTSSGVKLHRDTTIRAVKPDSRGTDTSGPPSRGRIAKNFENTMKSDAPKLKLKVKRGKVVPASEQDTTFLADSSGGEEKDPVMERSATASSLGFRDDRRPQTSPTSPTHPSTPMRSVTNSSQIKANSAEKRDKQIGPHQLDIAKTKSSEAGATVRNKVSRTVSGNRVWLEPSSSDEKLNDSQVKSPPYEDAPAQPLSAGHRSESSATEVFYSTSSLPIVQVDSTDSARPAANEPSAEDRERAAKIFSGDEEFMSKAKAVAWLGESTETSSRTRKAYMDLYDWSGQNILMALRDMCGKLVLKAETQQVDRVLAAFAQRWWDCNPNNGFKSTDLVHAVTYSVLLLNTDLHMADIESKMTRVQFVKNTMPTMRRLAEEVGGEPTEEVATIKAPSTQQRATQEQRGFVPWVQHPDPPPRRPHSGRVTPNDDSNRPSLDNKASRNRLSIRPPAFRTESDEGQSTATADNCTVLVKAPYEGSLKGWELQVEIVLKEFYNSIRSQRLPLHGAPTQPTEQQEPANRSLGVNSHLRRTPSVLSKANSEHLSYRGRSNEFRSTTARYNSKNRSRPHLYPTSTVGSSRTSLDDQSVWSPAGSSTWSKYSLGKTQASMMSVDSLGTHYGGADYQQSIGFANALSQAIIREEGTNASSSEEITRVAPLLEDESLELAGAPWAKEGILKHKHHLETVDKKAKDRGWNECFAVIEKGYMRLFSFNANSKSMRHKNKSKTSGGVVGGGNWAENAENMGSFLLRQTIANALPPPGYSKSRPHVWALSLPTGAVHLFQVGTTDIVREFVSTANYWSARLSKEPLVGGVSNIEYGWGENVINSALIRPESSSTTHGHSHNHGSVSLPRSSMQSSIRSSFDQGGSVKARLPGDKVAIYDWTPPVSSMMASNLMAIDQLRALQAYVRNIEDELARHNELRPPMLIAFSPRHPNAGKALANWEKKSSYLLREIVKFRTYIEALQGAETAKERIEKEREARRREKEEADPLSAMSVEVDDGGWEEGIGRLIT